MGGCLGLVYLLKRGVWYRDVFITLLLSVVEALSLLILMILLDLDN